MIIVYTGNGKDKTSACIGQAIRALGNGLNLAIGRFIKNPTLHGSRIVWPNSWATGSMLPASLLSVATSSRQ